VSFARATHDWEVNVFALFFRALYLVREKKMGTSYGGFPSKEGCLVLNPFTVSCVVMTAALSLGRVFGGLRFR
jgi:hypothetical protein